METAPVTTITHSTIDGPLPEQSGTNYGYFGYQGAMCDRALRYDLPNATQQCIDRGYMTTKTETLDQYGMVRYARRYGSLRAVAVLLANGWPDETY